MFSFVQALILWKHHTSNLWLIKYASNEPMINLGVKSNILTKALCTSVEKTWLSCVEGENSKERLNIIRTITLMLNPIMTA